MGVDGLDSPSCVKGISGLSLLLPNYLRIVHSKVVSKATKPFQAGKREPHQI